MPSVPRFTSCGRLVARCEHARHCRRAHTWESFLKPFSLERKAVIGCRFDRSRSASVDCILFVNVRTFEEQSTASTARIGPTSSFLLKLRPRHRTRSCVSGPLETADGWTQFVHMAAPANGRPRGHVTSRHLNVVGTAPAPGPSTDGHAVT